jgi:hypothetical protein
LNPSQRYALLANPIPETQDADNDGFEEVFVETRIDSDACVSVFRVRDVGAVDILPTRPALFGVERCPRAVADVDLDGRAELLVDVQLLEFQLESPPTVRIVLWADEHRYVLLDADDRAQRWFDGQVAQRELELEQARQDRSLQTTFRLAVELAVIARLQERPRADQLARFEQTVAGLRLSVAEQNWVAAARAEIAADWTPNPKLAALPGPSATTELAERDASWYITPPHEQERQVRTQRRNAHLPKSKGGAKLRRGGTNRSGHHARWVRGQKPARKTRRP